MTHPLIILMFVAGGGYLVTTYDFSVPQVAFLALLLFACFYVVNNILDGFQRAFFLHEFDFSGVAQLLTREHPEWDATRVAKAVSDMRQYFLSYQAGDNGVLSEDGRIAIELFLLCTKEYREFCQKAFGHTLHYVPAIA